MKWENIRWQRSLVKAGGWTPFSAPQDEYIGGRFYTVPTKINPVYGSGTSESDPNEI